MQNLISNPIFRKSSIFVSVLFWIFTFAIGFLYWGFEPISKKIVNKIYRNILLEEGFTFPVSAESIESISGKRVTLGGRGEGLDCSIPPIANRVFGSPDRVALWYRQACVFHDYCYRHGAATYNYTQLDCDILLQEQAGRICKYTHKETYGDECKTETRKLLLGVRLGGAGSFKPSVEDICDPGKSCDIDIRETSTYFEFNPLPYGNPQGYTVMRIAPLPGKVGKGFLRRGLYYFKTRPSGISVTVIGIQPDGRLKKVRSYSTPGSSNYLVTPPIVASDRFFWWRRTSMRHFGGTAYTLNPVSDEEGRWQSVFDSSSSDKQVHASIMHVLPGATGIDMAGLTIPLQNPDGKGKHASAPYIVRLSGDEIQWLCLDEDSCMKEDAWGKNFYRSYAIAPVLRARGEDTLLYFTRRGNGSEDQTYKEQMSLSEVNLKYLSNDAKPHNPIVHHYPTMSERNEPFAIVPVGDSAPNLISLTRNPENSTEPMKVSWHYADKKQISEATCEGIDGTWLDLPPTLLGDSSATLVLRHVLFEGKSGSPSKATIEIARFRLSDGTCSKEGEVAQVVLTDDDLKAYTNNPTKVRSLMLDQSVVADINDDNRLDFVLAQKYEPERTVVRLNVFKDP